MKKAILSVLLVLALLLCGAAVAEENARVEVPDMGVSFNLPTDWYDMVLIDEDYADGMLYGANNLDASSMLLVYRITFPLAEGEAATIDDIVAALSEDYKDVAVTEFNGIPMVTYTADDAEMICAALPTEGGADVMMFYPITENGFDDDAQAILNSLQLLK